MSTIRRAGRQFEVAKGFEEEGITLPFRATQKAAGYDFESAADVTIYPIWGVVFKAIGSFFGVKGDESTNEGFAKLLKPTLIPTGVKAYMEEDEVLSLYNRSGNPLKKLILLGNGVGVIDSDYYGNPDNDGNIMFQFWNFGIVPLTIKKGERIGQGVFSKFLKTSDDVPGGQRLGGHGSTN
jgi:dUTP pyrophosphatase